MTLFDSEADFGGRMTPAVRLLLIVTAASFGLVWIFGHLLDLDLVAWGGLSGAGLRRGLVWQPFTYLLLHGGAWHLIANLFGLFFFGPEVERATGTAGFVVLYLVCGVLGGLSWLLVSAAPAAVCIGASGAVFGILGVFAALFPRRPVTLLVFFVLPVTLTARTLVLVFAAVSLLAVLGEAGGIAHAAHLAGGAAGYLWGMHLRRRSVVPAAGGWRQWTAHWRRRPRLRLQDVTPEPPSAAEVDRVLDRMNAVGYSGLTRSERAILERASRRG